jgi:F-type H+-transporting ATPase subunit delta
MSGSTAARRYAKALFELCLEKSKEDAVKADLQQLVSLMSTSPEWASFVEAPFGAVEKRAQTLEETLRGRVQDLTLQFLAFIDSKRRLNLLVDIAGEWLRLYDETKGYLRATAVTVRPLEKRQMDELTVRLSRRFGKNVILSTQLDPALIGGMKVHVGDQVLDYSAETQLQRLKKRMIYA